MNNSLLLSLATSVIPILALTFVAALVIYKIYVKIRSKFNANVNCWFCNQNAKVPYLQRNSWTCPKCEQYNGFTKDGDYNREIFEQLDCSNSATQRLDYAEHTSTYCFSGRQTPRNGFCNACNEAQRLKVEKLAQFEPKNETHFDAELKVYKAQLEEQYRLCATCDRHLNKVLREKKKMVLGSKFLDFIIKGAETLKQPHFNQIRLAQQQQWKRRFTLFTTIVTLVNVCCLINALPPLTHERLAHYFGEQCGHRLFIFLSHVLAFVRVFGVYLERLTNHATVIKFGLFMRTLFMMLMYSLGLKMPQIVRLQFSPLYMLASPFAILGFAFAHNIVDSFRLSRYTFLLVLWSVFAGGLIEEQIVLSKQSLELFASLLTLMLSATCKNEPTSKLHDTSTNSFHKIYSEDYLSDEETISMLSQQLDNSAASVRSVDTNQSFNISAGTQPNNGHFLKSPFTSSTLSLQAMPRTQFSPNSSFKTCYNDDSRKTHYAASICGDFNANPLPRAGHFQSNLELSCRTARPQSAIFGASNNNNTASLANNSYGNCSFAEPNARPLRTQPQSVCNFSFTERALPQHNTIAAPLLSPFSVSSSAVHQQQQQHQRSTYLLTPSRFSTNCLASNDSATSWLSGGYFNQRQQQHTLLPNGEKMRNNFFLEHRNGMQATALDENLSRASSHSSGFESQNGRLNLSRENSYCPETAELMQRTLPLEHNTAFKPVEPKAVHGYARAFGSTTQLTQPLMINCVSQSATWKSPALRATRDSFNLRKINEELPTIKRGDLLRKWQESQAIS